MSSKQVTSIKIFLIFVRHSMHYCWLLRSILGMQFAIILSMGILFAWFESIPAGQGLYFSMITSTTVGFGDITPNTGIGQLISVVLGCLGLISFGLVVAVATQAFKVTIEECLLKEDDSPTTESSDPRSRT
ncbi:potassium channel family protein [Gimesia sp.]|uniref:potassium channel family protein n=1 Tax=Gimesia sp. TaxID=2024833 RepID=UPI0032EC3202